MDRDRTEQAREPSRRHLLARTRARLILVFDDGPTALTPRILDLLAEHGAQAIFFVIGRQIAENEGLLMRMRDEGHAIGNHTTSHPRLTELGSSAVMDEIASCRDAIEAVTGTPPRSFRPPFAAYDGRVLEIAGLLGHDRLVLAPSLGDYALSTEAIVERAVGADFLGLHELPQTVAALPRILEACAA